jgi:acylphosphatase
VTRDLPERLSPAADPPESQSGVGSPSPGDDEEQVRLTAWVRGRVQGVGFRWWTRSRALELGLTGWALNLDDGRVEVVAEGTRSACEALLAALRSPAPPGHVALVVEQWSHPRATRGFIER